MKWAKRIFGVVLILGGLWLAWLIFNHYILAYISFAKEHETSLFPWFSYLLAMLLIPVGVVFAGYKVLKLKADPNPTQMSKQRTVYPWSGVFVLLAIILTSYWIQPYNWLPLLIGIPLFIATAVLALIAIASSESKARSITAAIKYIVIIYVILAVYYSIPLHDWLSDLLGVLGLSGILSY